MGRKLPGLRLELQVLLRDGKPLLQSPNVNIVEGYLRGEAHVHGQVVFLRCLVGGLRRLGGPS